MSMSNEFPLKHYTTALRFHAHSRDHLRINNLKCSFLTFSRCFKDYRRVPVP